MRTYAQKPKASQKTPAEANKILNLQRTIGNQAVQRLLQTNPDGFENSPNTTSATAHFGFDLSRIPLYSRAQLKQRTHLAEIRVQTDEYVAASAEALAAEGYAKRSDLHRHSAGPGPAAVPAIVHEVLRGPGQPIPDGVRYSMEARLG